MIVSQWTFTINDAEVNAKYKHYIQEKPIKYLKFSILLWSVSVFTCILIHLRDEVDFLMPTYIIYTSVGSLILSILSYWASTRKRWIVDVAGLILYLIP